jgi:hypothetical protein
MLSIPLLNPEFILQTEGKISRPARGYDHRPRHGLFQFGRRGAATLRDREGVA